MSSNTETKAGELEVGDVVVLKSVHASPLIVTYVGPYGSSKHSVVVELERDSFVSGPLVIDRETKLTLV